MVAKTVDFTNVKDGGGTFNKRHVTAGDYPARITKVTDSPSKKDNVFQWCFTITTEAGGTYPYYCKLQENQLWKLRNLCMAAGMNVPKKKLKLDPEKLVGKRIAVTLEDDEYEGKMQSVVEATFPLSELGENATDDDADDDDDDTDDDDEEDTPPAKSNGGKKAKKAAPPVDEDEDDEEEDDDEDETPAAVTDDYTSMDRSDLKQALKILDEDFQVKKSMTDDDLRAKARELDSAEEEDDEEDEEPTPPPAKKKAKAKAKKVEVTDDELDELDIDDL